MRITKDNFLSTENKVHATFNYDVMVKGFETDNWLARFKEALDEMMFHYKNEFRHLFSKEGISISESDLPFRTQVSAIDSTYGVTVTVRSRIFGKPVSVGMLVDLPNKRYNNTEFTSYKTLLVTAYTDVVKVFDRFAVVTKNTEIVNELLRKGKPVSSPYLVQIDSKVAPKKHLLSNLSKEEVVIRVKEELLLDLPEQLLNSLQNVKSYYYNRVSSVDYISTGNIEPLQGYLLLAYQTMKHKRFAAVLRTFATPKKQGVRQSGTFIYEFETDGTISLYKRSGKVGEYEKVMNVHNVTLEVMKEV